MKFTSSNLSDPYTWELLTSLWWKSPPWGWGACRGWQPLETVTHPVVPESRWAEEMAGLQGLIVRAVRNSQGRQEEEVPCNYHCLNINTCLFGFFLAHNCCFWVAAAGCDCGDVLEERLRMTKVGFASPAGFLPSGLSSSSSSLPACLLLTGSPGRVCSPHHGCSDLSKSQTRSWEPPCLTLPIPISRQTEVPRPECLVLAPVRSPC